MSDYSREEVEELYKVKLTDRQWEILQEEVEGKEDWEDTWVDVIDDVIENLKSYEEEHGWWDSMVSGEEK